ncbi:MAG: type III pantothenate kinase [Gammaproteobacteria bacterium]
MRLLIDMGNSRIKWAAAEAHRLSATGAVSHEGEDFITGLQQKWSGLARPEAVFIASVVRAALNGAVSRLVSDLWGLEPVLLSSEAESGALKNAYRDYREMGVDRWAAMLAAVNLYPPPLCVIDFGTAVTVDIIDKDKQHRGGYIMPGQGLAAIMLSKAAHGLSATRPQQYATEPGLATQECLANGYATALVGFVRQAMEQAQAITDGEVKLIITGGGAKAISPLLPMDYIHDKDLVLSGMAYMTHTE